jgi:imidazolonepropionase-like amidohydrolase
MSPAKTRIVRRWIFGFIKTSLIALLVAVAVFWLLMIWPRRIAHPPLQLGSGTLAIQHARIYVSPNQPAIADGSVLIQNGRIAAIGPDVTIPAGASLIPCNHCTVTAGFWNTHVHFTEPKWSNAEWKPAATLNAQLADMLTSRGFTTVVDTGSNLSDTLPLRRRIESGELAGPHIFTAGAALYPPHGIPFYIRDTAPKWILLFFPQPDTPQEAEKDVQRNLDAGADITKLFTGSYIAHGKVLPMPLPIAKAAVERTHLNGRLVFAHPSDLAGTTVAIESGVDVLAHAPDSPEGIDQALLAKMVRQNMAMAPTLKMFATTVTRNPAYLDPIYAEVRQFHALGGQLLFGTDVGYMRDYTTDDEFAALTQCGLTPMDILAMLTTNPASRFGVADRLGTVAAGKLADLTVLDADPAQNSAAFARVRATIRSGRVIYSR